MALREEHAPEETQRLLPMSSAGQRQLATTASAGSPGGVPDPAPAPKQAAETGICRICLEEDLVTALESPCGCMGTQRFAHHACIQRWVTEKGNAKCEICEQPYRSDTPFVVPPPPPNATSALDGMPLFTQMYLLEASDPRRTRLDLLDADAALYQRNTGVSWVVSFILFGMLLVVMHNTLVVADGMGDYDGSDDGVPSTGGASGGAGGYDPAAGGGGMGPGAGGDMDNGAGSLMVFFLAVVTKFVLIGIPLYTLMKIAARQARREQFEAVLRAGAAYQAGRRLQVIRFGTTSAPGSPRGVAGAAGASPRAGAPLGTAQPLPLGMNAV